MPSVEIASPPDCSNSGVTASAVTSPFAGNPINCEVVFDSAGGLSLGKVIQPENPKREVRIIVTTISFLCFKFSL